MYFFYHFLAFCQKIYIEKIRSGAWLIVACGYNKWYKGTLGVYKFISYSEIVNLRILWLIKSTKNLHKLHIFCFQNLLDIQIPYVPK